MKQNTIVMCQLKDRFDDDTTLQFYRKMNEKYEKEKLNEKIRRYVANGVGDLRIV